MYMFFVSEDKMLNRIKAEEFIKKAAAENSSFILFPEMSLTGFSMKTDIMGEEKEGDSIAWFKKQAYENNINIGFGYIEKPSEKSKAKNNFAVISRSGEILDIYSKIHPFSFGKEAEYYEGGNTISTFDVDNVAVTSFICYDLRFPEIFQIASKKSQLITIAANWPKARIYHWQTLLKARAIENQCYIAAVNRTGTGGSLEYSGSSMIIDPTGKVLAMADDTESLLICNIDIDEVSSLRDSFKLKADRRENLYINLYKNITDKD